MVIPVCLPWTSSQSDLVVGVGKKFTVAGWGSTSNDKFLTDDNIQKFSASTRWVWPLLNGLDLELLQSVS